MTPDMEIETRYIQRERETTKKMHDDGVSALKFWNILPLPWTRQPEKDNFFQHEFFAVTLGLNKKF